MGNPNVNETWQSTWLVNFALYFQILCGFYAFMFLCAVQEEKVCRVDCFVNCSFKSAVSIIVSTESTASKRALAGVYGSV